MDGCTSLFFHAQMKLAIGSQFHKELKYNLARITAMTEDIDVVVGHLQVLDYDVIGADCDGSRMLANTGTKYGY